MRKGLFAGIGVAVLALIVGTYLVAFWPAEGQVAVSIDRSGVVSNPALSAATLTIVSGDQEHVVEVPPNSGGLEKKTSSTPIVWSLRSPIIATFQPGFRDDAPLELVVTPEDAGFWAGNAGQVVYLNLVMTDKESSLSVGPEAGGGNTTNSVSSARANETQFREGQDRLRATCEANGLEDTIAEVFAESQVYLDYFSGYEDLKDLGLRQGDAITVALRLGDMATDISAYVEDFDRRHDSGSQPTQVRAGQEILLGIAVKREQQGFAILDFKIELYQSLNGQIIADGDRFDALRDEFVASLEAEAPVRLIDNCAIAHPY
jgi:hypothetical protein